MTSYFFETKPFRREMLTAENTHFTVGQRVIQTRELSYVRS